MADYRSNRGAFPLPETIEEIDKEWLTAALRVKAPDVTVEDFKIVDMVRGTCTKIRLHLKMDANGKAAGIPESVILKGGFEPHSRDMHYMHEKEVRGYRDVFPVLGLRTPTCYFADFSDEQKHGLIIMEDLAHRGVEFCNPLKPQSHEQVAARLSALAQYHSKTWNSKEFEPGGQWDWMRILVEQNRYYFDNFCKPDLWNAYVASPRGAAVSVRFHSWDWMNGVVDRLIALGKRTPFCVVHGDTHLGNLYIDTDGAPGFFDSLSSRGHPMFEVSYHVTCALDQADRGRWERSLVQHYIDELSRNGVTPFGFDDAMEQYSAFLAFGYCVFLSNSSVFQSEAINTAYSARFSAAMIANDTLGALESIRI